MALRKNEENDLTCFKNAHGLVVDVDDVVVIVVVSFAEVAIIVEVLEETDCKSVKFRDFIST